MTRWIVILKCVPNVHSEACIMLALSDLVPLQVLLKSFSIQVFDREMKCYSPDKCFRDKSSLSFRTASDELPSMTTKQEHVKRNNKISMPI